MIKRGDRRGFENENTKWVLLGILLFVLAIIGIGIMLRPTDKEYELSPPIVLDSCGILLDLSNFYQQCLKTDLNITLNILTWYKVV